MLAVVADDDPDVRDLVADYLRHEGLEVAEAFDGHDLLEILDAREVHLVVTDEDMPRVAGQEVLRRVRGHGDRTPFVMITGRPDSVREAVDETEEAWLLAKPITRLGLLRALCTAFAKRR
jgi:DNA-binding response OmpR family regulator